MEHLNFGGCEWFVDYGCRRESVKLRVKSALPKGCIRSSQRSDPVAFTAHTHTHHCSTHSKQDLVVSISRNTIGN